MFPSLYGRRSSVGIRVALALLVVTILSFSPLHAQRDVDASEAADRVAAINIELLGVLSPPLGRVSSRLSSSQLASRTEQRADALQALIRADPSRALTLALPEQQLQQLRALFPDLVDQLESRGQWTGDLEYWIADNETFTRALTIRYIHSAEETLEVYFAEKEPADLTSGDLLQVEGIRIGSIVVASHATVSASLEKATQGEPMPGATTAATSCSPIGEQRIAAVLVTFPGVPLPEATPQDIDDIFFDSTGLSVDGYWREASYGLTSATGDVFGWFTLDRAYTCDEAHALREAAIQAADTQVDFRNYDRLYVIFPQPAEGCWFAGLANGCDELNSPGDGNFTASTAFQLAEAMVNRSGAVSLSIHEGGHNLIQFLPHASSLDYQEIALGGFNSFNLGTHSEYGDPFSAMGGGLGHYSARHKLRLGWLTSGTEVQTVNGSGTFVIRPLSDNTSGLKAIRVRRQAGEEDWLWIEYRQPIGLYDSTLPSQGFSGALIHYETPQNADSGPGLHQGNTHLLDFTPLSSSNEFVDFRDAPLAAGQSWQDLYSALSIDVIGATTESLTVSINEDPVCVSLLSPDSRDHVQSGGVGTVTIAAPEDCNWEVLAPESWVSVTSAPSGTGPGTVEYAVDVNADLKTRVGVISIGRIPFIITQDGVPSPPTIDSLWPWGTSPARQYFTLSASDQNGPQDLSLMGLSVGTDATAVNACRILYDRNANTVMLAEDGGTGWLGPVTSDQAFTLENSQCRIGVVEGFEVGGNRFEAEFGLFFKPAFAGARNLYGYVEDSIGLNTGWQNLGTYTVTVNHAPSVDSVVPTSGEGYSQLFSFRFSDLNGYTDILQASANFFSPTRSRQCLISYRISDESLFLYDNHTRVYVGPGTLGSGGTVENDICGVSLAASSAVGTAMELDLDLDIFFKAGFEGSTNFSVSVRDYYNDFDNVLAGTWTVGGCPADLVLADQTLSGTQTLEATSTATLGPNLIVDGDNIAVNAPVVSILNDTTISGTFSVGNNPVCP